MNGWIEPLSFSIVGAALLLSLIGLWFTVIIPGIDRWSRHFFIYYFMVFMLCCLFSIAETLFQNHPIPETAFRFLLFLETLLLSLPVPMLTVYLLHCSHEDTHKNRFLYSVLFLWGFQLLINLLSCLASVDEIIYVTSGNRYYRGTLYPLFLLPTIIILFLNLSVTIRRRKLLSRKAFLAFLIAILSITASVTLQLFIEVFPFVGISYVISALAMYSIILSDQIEQDLRLQREIAIQQQEIAGQQREIAHERAKVMVLRMRPHFIYNTLMSIYSLCRTDPAKARQITMDFTNYLRRNFNAVASDSAVPFSTELEHTRAYLGVEQAQYDDMLAVEYDIPYTQFRLPPLTLQPIVENAVKHGMDPDSGPLHIRIRTRHTGSCTTIIVEDSGPGFDPSIKIKPHTTLANIRQRLEMMCGGSLAFTAGENGGTVATVTIPDSSGQTSS